MATKREIKVDTTVRCGTCGLYKNPRKKMEYPNSEGGKQWVICGVGNCINDRSMGCQYHSSGISELPHMPEPKTEPKPKPKQEISELLGGIDFDNMLKEEINKIGAKA